LALSHAAGSTPVVVMERKRRGKRTYRMTHKWSCPKCYKVNPPEVEICSGCGKQPQRRKKQAVAARSGRRPAPASGIQRRSKIPKKKSQLADMQPPSRMERMDADIQLCPVSLDYSSSSKEAAMPAASSKLWDTYPVFDKRNCPHKEKSNSILAEMGRDVVCRACLILDAATHLTTLKLLETGWWAAKDIHVPNACDDAFDAIQRSGNCNAYKMSLSDFMRECRKKHHVQMFGTIYLDYCTTLDGGFTRFNTSPRYDIQELFRLQLISPHGSVLAVTLCKPKEDETPERQFCKLRHLLSAMCLKYDMAIVFHEESNSYDNWRTEFYTIGRADHMKRFFRMTEQSAQEAAQRVLQRAKEVPRPSAHSDSDVIILDGDERSAQAARRASPQSSTTSVTPIDFKGMTCKKKNEVVVLDDDVIVVDDDVVVLDDDDGDDSPDDANVGGRRDEDAGSSRRTDAQEAKAAKRTEGERGSFQKIMREVEGVIRIFLGDRRSDEESADGDEDTIDLTVGVT